MKTAHKFHVPIYQNGVDGKIFGKRDQSTMIACISDGCGMKIAAFLPSFSKHHPRVNGEPFCFITFLSKTKPGNSNSPTIIMS